MTLPTSSTPPAASPNPPPVLLLDDRSILGGGQRQLLLLAEGLRDADWPYRIVCKAGSPLAEEAAAQQLQTACLPLRSEFDAWSAWRLKRLAKRLGAGIIHAHAPHAHGIMWLARMAGMRGVHIAHRHIDFVIKRGFLRSAKYLRGCDLVVAVSRGVQQRVLDAGVPESRTRVIPAVIDDRRFVTASPADLRRELSLPDDAQLVGTVGALKPYKGHRHLIDAWPRVLETLPGAACVIAGDGELRDELTARIAELDLGRRVFLLGHRSDVPAVLAALDLFVLPSLHEGMPGALLEAMLSEKPCVATDCAGSEELLPAEWIVPREQPAPLAAAIVRLLRDEAARASLAAQGPAIVRGSFLPRHMQQQTLDLYRELLQRPPRGPGS